LVGKRPNNSIIAYTISKVEKKLRGDIKENQLNVPGGNKT
jgi:hypothetical protein